MISSAIERANRIGFLALTESRMDSGVKCDAPKQCTMTDLPSNMSPKTFARIGGALYLVIIALGLLGESFVRDRLIVSGDATATAANIALMEPLWRFGIAAELLLLLCCDVDMDLLCFIAAGQRRSRLAGGVLQFGVDGIGSGDTTQFRCRVCFRSARLRT